MTAAQDDAITWDRARKACTLTDPRVMKTMPNSSRTLNRPGTANAASSDLRGYLNRGHHGHRTSRHRPGAHHHSPGGRGHRRAARQAPWSGSRARIPGRRVGHRAVRLQGVQRTGGNPAGCGTGRGDVPVHHWPRDATAPPVGDAPPDLRAWFRPGCGLRGPAHPGRTDRRIPGGGLIRRRSGIRTHLHGHCHAGAGGARRTGL